MGIGLSELRYNKVTTKDEKGWITLLLKWVWYGKFFGMCESTMNMTWVAYKEVSDTHLKD